MLKKLLLLTASLLGTIALAAPVSISDRPLNTNGSDVARPNIMLLFDDSGSMAETETPDYVSSARLCMNTSTTTTGANATTRKNNISGTCSRAAPVLHSPDTNFQYYNPEILYSPPVRADLTLYPSMTAGVTFGWSSVPVNGFRLSDGTFNILTNYPTWRFCNPNGDCAGDTNYNLPQLTNETPIAAMQTRDALAVSGPHYYRIPVTEHCRDEGLKDCTASASPTGLFIYPARVRFCKDIDRVDCQGVYYPDSGYNYPKYLGFPRAGTPARAAATLRVTNFVSSSNAKITSLMIDGQELAGAGISINQANATGLATAIANIITTTSTNFEATSSGDTVTIRARVTGSVWNTKNIQIQSTQTIDQPAVWRLNVINANNPSLSRNNCLRAQGGTGTSVLIGSTPVTNTTVDQCNSTTVNAVYDLNNLVATRLTSNFAIHTSVTNAGNNRFFQFRRSTSQGALDNTTCTISLRSSAPTSIAGTTCARVQDGVTGGALFSVNGTTAAKDSSGTTSGGGDFAYREDKVAFQRVDILPANTYPKTPARTDCAGAVCTYDEEMTNFANWYAYYRTRMLASKTAAGLAFSRLNDNYRVGMALLNNTTITEVNQFALASPATHRTNWYNRLYNVNPSGGTPLRSALSRMGRYYAGKLGGNDPVEFSCQKNYTILLTDGYWNGGAGVDVDNATISTSVDSVLGPYVSRPTGVFDGTNTAGTLSDVAQYYYQTDLRTGGADPKAKNNVPVSAKDPNPAQHMNTYTIGLGINGAMQYKKDYASSSTGDFAKIANGDTNCHWQTPSSICNWPIPLADGITTADDLWHAAVNGRGTYSSARSAVEIGDSLREALSDVVTVTGSAAASATSSPNITPTDNFIYSTTYQTALWDGEIVAQRIDPATGNVNAGIDWKASDSVNAQADALYTDPTARTLITYNTGGGGKPFTFASLSATEKGWFSNHCSNGNLIQCAELEVTGARRVQADKPETMIEFVRGQNTANVFFDGVANYGYLDIYRSLRTSRMGDPVNSTPLFVKKPLYNFKLLPTEVADGYEKYDDFKTRISSRNGTLYVGANHGMMHAFDGNTGIELFAYVPRTTMPEMWRIADRDYANKHRYFVDGSPSAMDVLNPTTKQWHTVLVGGYRKGGSGYFAMDITDPDNPVPLWEICNSAVLCPGRTVSNMGLSFGVPVITRLPAGTIHAGKWVALLTSGYNNIPSNVTQPTAGAGGAGDGRGYLYVVDIWTGAILQTYQTAVGNTTTPAGLGKVSTLAPNFAVEGESTIAYAGDLLGNVWRFNLALPAADANAVKRVTTLTNASNQVQPITTKIEIGGVPNDPDKPILIVATGQYLGTPDLTDTTQQSIYAIKDPYAYGGVSPVSNRGADMVNQTIIDVGATRTIDNPNPVDWSSKNGWYIDLPDSGERVSIDPTLNLGTLLVPANVVNGTLANACEVAGYSWLYQLDYATGSFVSTSTGGAVATKVPSAIIVGTVVIRLPNGTMKIITTTASGGKLPFGMNIRGSSGAGQRISWREIPQ